MPQEQPQLDSGYDYAKLPDGSYAKLKRERRLRRCAVD